MCLGTHPFQTVRSEVVGRGGAGRRDRGAVCVRKQVLICGKEQQRPLERMWLWCGDWRLAIP